jgi:choline dehydrogenase-like flavoprotein
MVYENVTNSDVVIVGSGPAGISSAWPLVEAGFKVTLLDGATCRVPEPPRMNISTFRRHPTNWQHAFGDDFSGLNLQENLSPKFGTRIAAAVLRTEVKLEKIRTHNFLAVRSLTAGGLSNVWGALAATFNDDDLVNYPIKASDLASSYQSVGQRIGLSGGQDDLTDFLGSGLALQSPTWLMPIAKRLLESYQLRKSPGALLLGTARNAVITDDVNGRERCNSCGLCLYGCARGAIYSAAQDLAYLKSKANFAYLSGAIVTRLLPTDRRKQVVEASTGDNRVAIGARAVIVAAGTLNSTALVLRSQRAIGKKLRLLTNPAAAMAFVIPSFIGAPLPVESFSLGQLSYRLQLREIPEYVTGALYSADALPLSTIVRRLPFSRPCAMRLAQMVAPALLVATLYLPGRLSRNYIALERTVCDSEQIHVEGGIASDARHLFRIAARKLTREMRRLGAFAVPGSLRIVQAGGDAHPAGTLPMKNEDDEFTCTAAGELRHWPNVFVVDGSCLSDLPAKAPTFTIMANADRIGRILATKLTSSAA